MNQGNERTTSMSKTKGLVQMAIFAALIVVLAFTPFIGYIPLGFTRATIIHIPVIMGSLMLGPKKGAALGGVFGGAMTNTLLVMNLIFVFFRNDYAAANGITVKAVYGFILSIIGINGIPEAIVAAVITLVLGKTLMKKGVQERLGV